MEINSGLSSIFSDSLVVMYFLLSSGKTVAIFKSSLSIMTLARKFAPLEMPIPKPNSLAILFDMFIDSEEIVRDILKIDGHYRIVGILALGHSDNIPKPHDESDLDKNKIHFLV